ncbi:uncharacterized protein LOC9644221 isoform X1 [Selaginella moellendorffii]|nr:uncharacterized protein LOC9644221 isoform X1 [Selaginella moellendorffii]|eukprot:XP_002983979.2 uncharacterized protein LOC9644221 isoform X1 [Selaginella moellendorffii]
MSMGSLAVQLGSFHGAQILNPSTVKKKLKRKSFSFSRVNALYADDGEIAPQSKGDGFSFYGGKYSDERDKTDDWWARGDFMYAYSPQGSSNTVKEPLFGMKLGAQSQISSNEYRWFYVEEGTNNNHTILLLHGLCSQAYSFRHVISILAKDYHVIAVDWLGFGFSDKPLYGNGFNYTTQEYTNALSCLVDRLKSNQISIVAQGHFTPPVVEYISANPFKIVKLIMINPPVSKEHSTLPSNLLEFTNLFLGDIFSQDPFKASDGAMSRISYYAITEEDKMVYRKPYLSSGSAGFALKSVIKSFKKELKDSILSVRSLLTSKNWETPIYFIGGLNDRWLNYKSLKTFCEEFQFKLITLDKGGHLLQEDIEIDLANIITGLLESP